MSWSVLLVDDEWLVRRELNHIVNWGKLGFMIVGEAANGQAALQLMSELTPDLVVLDIQMPGMDGVELAKQLAVSYPQTRMLVVSSHDQFDYVKSTLKSGASDYILKHELTAGSLTPVLTSIHKQLEQDRQQEKEEDRKTSERKSSYAALLRHYVRELVLGNSPEWQHWMKAYPYTSQRSGLLVFQVAHFFKLTLDKTDMERSQFVQSIQEVCQQGVGLLEQGCAVHIDHGRYAVLVGYQQISSESIIYQDLGQLEGQISRSLHLLMNVRVAVQAAGVCTNIAAVPNMYARASEKLRYLTGMEPDTPTEWSLGSEKFERLFTIQEEKQLLTAVIGGEDLKVANILEKIMGTAGTLTTRDTQVQMLLNELMTLARKVAVKSGLKQLDLLETKLQELMEFSSLEAICQQLKDIFLLIARSLREIEPEVRSPYVQQAIQHIQRCYREELSLDVMAKQLNLSSSYLSRLFKSEIGMGFVEYVNRIRVEAGKDMLQSGELSVKEVYERVGFNNYSYFFRVFKEITGLTPQQAARRER